MADKNFRIKQGLDVGSAEVIDVNGNATFTSLTTPTINSLAYPSVDGTTGQVLTTDGAGTLTFAAGIDSLDDLSDVRYPNELILQIGSIRTSSITESAPYVTSVGTNALEYLTTGQLNTAIGYKAGQNLTWQDSLTAIGFQAGQNASGNDVVAIGENAAQAAGSGTIAIGTFAGRYSGIDNINIGYRTGERSVGTGNISIGKEAVLIGFPFTNFTGNYNIVIGHGAQRSDVAASNELTFGGDSGATGEITRLRIPGLGLDTADASDGEVLSWDGTNSEFVWAASTPAVSSIGDLTDVDLSTAPTDGQILHWDNTNGVFVPTDKSAPETNTTLTADSVNQKLVYTDENGTSNDIDLSWTIDDTNLARITSGTVDANTGIATFTRDDATTFTTDFSALFDDTNLTRITSSSVDTNTNILTLTRSDATTVTVDLSHLDDSGIKNVVEDTTPQLGGSLDLNGYRLEENASSNQYAYLDLETTNGSLLRGNHNSGAGNDGLFIVSGSAADVRVRGGGHYNGQTASAAGDVIIEGGYTFYNATKTGSVIIRSGLDLASTGSLGDVIIQDLTYPAVDGSSGQVLTTDGAGTLTFADKGDLDEVDILGIGKIQAWNNTYTSSQDIAVFQVSEFRTMKIVIQVTDNTNGGFYTSELLCMHDNADASFAEYATMSVGGHNNWDGFEIIPVVESGNFVIRTVQPSSAELEFKFMTQLITV